MPAAIRASFTGSALNGLITASIFFTGPKLEPVHQMASNPIQTAVPFAVKRAPPGNEKEDQVCAAGFTAHNFRR
jgi:hypothetical protein